MVTQLGMMTKLDNEIWHNHTVSNGHISTLPNGIGFNRTASISPCRWERRLWLDIWEDRGRWQIPCTPGGQVLATRPAQYSSPLSITNIFTQDPRMQYVVCTRGYMTPNWHNFHTLNFTWMQVCWHNTGKWSQLQSCTKVILSLS